MALLDIRERQAEQVLAAAAKAPEDMRPFLATMAEHALGRSEAAGRHLSECSSQFGADDPGRIVELLAWTGRKDEAFAWLEEGVERGQVDYRLTMSPLLAGLQDDPRWGAFLKKMKLPVD